MLLLVGKLIGIALYAIAIAVSILWLGAKGGKAPHSAIAFGFVGHWSGTKTQIAHAEPSLPRALFPKGIVIGGKELFSDATYKQSGREIKTTYPMTIFVRPGELFDHIGTVTNPECGADLILLAASSARILVEDSLTSGFSACTNHTKITLRLKADGTLDYYAEVPDLALSASANLKRIDLRDR